MGTGAAAGKPADLWGRAGLPPASGWAVQVLDAMATLEAPVPEAASQAQARAWLSRWIVSPKLCLVRAAEGQSADLLCDLLKHSGWRLVREKNNSPTGGPHLRALATGAALWIGLDAGEEIGQAPGPVAPGFSPPFHGVIQPLRLRAVRTEDGGVLLDDSWKVQGEGVTAQAAEQAMQSHFAETLRAKIGILSAKMRPQPAVVSVQIQRAGQDIPAGWDWLALVPGEAKRLGQESSQPAAMRVSLPEGPGALLIAAARAGPFRAESLEPLVLTEKAQAGQTVPRQQQESSGTPP